MQSFMELRDALLTAKVDARIKLYQAMGATDVISCTDLARKAGVDIELADDAARWLVEREYFSAEVIAGSFIYSLGSRQVSSAELGAAFSSAERASVRMPRARSSPSTSKTGRYKSVVPAQQTPQEMSVTAGVQVSIQGRNFTLTFSEADKLFRLLQKVFPGSTH